MNAQCPHHIQTFTVYDPSPDQSIRVWMVAAGSCLACQEWDERVALFAQVARFAKKPLVEFIHAHDFVRRGCWSVSRT